MVVTGKKPAAISGVSAISEATILTTYPSIASTGIGRLLGRLYDSIPLKICGIKLSHLLFVLPTAPIAALLYFVLKATGYRYVLTNRSVQKWAALGSRRESQVSLTDIDQVVVHEEPGQAFFRAADLYLLNKAGDRLMVLEGVPYPAILRQTILEARDARLQVTASLEAIRSRPAV